MPRLQVVVFGRRRRRPSLDAASADGTLFENPCGRKKEPDESRLLRGLVQDRTGRRRHVRARDWNAPRRFMDRTDKKLGACKAWILGGSAGDSADQPCIVFLTNRALYVDVWPYDGGTPGLIVAPFHMIAKCEIWRNDIGGTRLDFILDTKGNQNRAELRSMQSIFRETDVAPPTAGWSSIQSAPCRPAKVACVVRALGGRPRRPHDQASSGR